MFESEMLGNKFYKKQIKKNLRRPSFQSLVDLKNYYTLGNIILEKKILAKKILAIRKGL